MENGQREGAEKIVTELGIEKELLLREWEKIGRQKPQPEGYK